MSDFDIRAARGATIRFRVTATKTLDDGTVQPVNLAAANTHLIATFKLNPADPVALLVKDYFQEGGSPHGGITVPAPGQVATNVAEVRIEANDPAILALTKTTYLLGWVQLIEPDGTETEIATGVVKVRVGP